MPSSIPLEIARLVLGQRWGAVAILEAGAPVGSMVAYASEPGLDTVVFFIISQLSAHARSML